MRPVATAVGQPTTPAIDTASPRTHHGIAATHRRSTARRAPGRQHQSATTTTGTTWNPTYPWGWEVAAPAATTAARPTARTSMGTARPRRDGPSAGATDRS